MDTGTIAAAIGADLAPLAPRRDILEPKENSDDGFGTPNKYPRRVRTRDAEVKVDVDPWFITHKSKPLKGSSGFSFGRVFKVLWSEPAGSWGTEVTLRSERQSFGKRTYSKTQKYRRKAVQVTLDGHEYTAFPDSGSDKNIMAEDFAKQHGISIQRHEDDKSLFQLGTGKYIQSIGRAYMLCGLSGQSWMRGSQEPRWFHVLKKCVAPLIVGMEFLEKTKLFTKYKHLLVDCPFSFGNIPTLKYIGSRQASLNFRADGTPLTGCLDTGADLDFMSLRAAIEHGFKIDRRQEARTRVMLSDCSIVETVGQVRTSVEISEFDKFDMTFNVLAGLPCDAIFSDDFVEQTDAFNSCSELSGNETQHRHTLKVLINLGPLQSLFSKKRKPEATNTAQQKHDQEMETEYHRRNKAARSIWKMYDQDEMSKAREAEVLKVEMFDRIHKNCVYCRSEGPGRMLRRPGLKPPDIFNSGSLGGAQSITTGHIR